MTAVSPFFTFPRISWWKHILGADTLILDKAEHYEKMTDRNRYAISGPNNAILLSVPLTHGRNQRIPMRDVHIHNTDKWQVQHWRTLTSVYNRTPYFQHYAPTLQPLYDTEYTSLIDFNRAALLWTMKQLTLNIELQETDGYIKEYPEEIEDLRDMKRVTTFSLPAYYQIFEDRIGFLPDLSILDLLFSEGPATRNMLT